MSAENLGGICFHVNTSENSGASKARMSFQVGGFKADARISECQVDPEAPKHMPERGDARPASKETRLSTPNAALNTPFKQRMPYSFFCARRRSNVLEVSTSHCGARRSMAPTEEAARAARRWAKPVAVSSSSRMGVVAAK